MALSRLHDYGNLAAYFTSHAAAAMASSGTSPMSGFLQHGHAYLTKTQAPIPSPFFLPTGKTFNFHAYISTLISLSQFQLILAKRKFKYLTNKNDTKSQFFFRGNFGDFQKVSFKIQICLKITLRISQESLFHPYFLRNLQNNVEDVKLEPYFPINNCVDQNEDLKRNGTCRHQSEWNQHQH